MNNQDKMLRKKKGKCPIHGDWCCVAEEIQSDKATKARSIEKQEVQKEIQQQIHEDS